MTFRAPTGAARSCSCSSAFLAVGTGNTMLTSAVLPPLTRELKLPDWTAGAIFSLSAAIWVITAPYWGAKSNAWGRRRVAAIGMFGFAASMFFFAITAMAALLGWITGWVLVFALLLTARSLFGIFGSATNPAAQAYVADRTTRDERMDEIATLTSGFTLGQMAGPAAAAALISAGAFLSPTVGLPCAGRDHHRYRQRDRRAHTGEAARASSAAGRCGLARSGTKGLWLRSPRSFLPALCSWPVASQIGVLSQTFPYAIMDRMHVEGTVSAQCTGPAMTAIRN